MTTDDAYEILHYLQMQLRENGFSDIIDEVEGWLEDDTVQNNIQGERSINYVIRYLDGTITALDSYSGLNEKYDRIKNNINEYVGEIKLDNIAVLNSENRLVPLSQIPDYSEIVEVLRSIRAEITERNQ